MFPKRILSALLVVSTLLLIIPAIYADFNLSNTKRISKTISYRQDSDGFYIKNAPREVDSLGGNYTILGKTNKQNCVLALKDFALYRIILAKDSYKLIRKDKNIQQLSEEEMLDVEDYWNERLKSHFDSLNYSRRVFITDSVRKVREVERMRRKQIEDSLNNIRKIERERIALENYKSSHYPYILPNGDPTTPIKERRLECIIPDCGFVFTKENIPFVRLDNDYIVFASEGEEPILGLSPYMRFHAAPLPDYIKKSDSFRYHMKAFGDSLEVSTCTDSFKELAILFSITDLNNYLKRLEKAAPYGYVENWSWDENYGTLDFSLSYCNLNKKTIKYLKIFFALTNDVGDVRSTGHLQGTGPVEQYTSASWNWDNTLYFILGDASRLRITKLQITYMDGTVKTIHQNSIKFK